VSAHAKVLNYKKTYVVVFWCEASSLQCESLSPRVEKHMPVKGNFCFFCGGGRKKTKKKRNAKKKRFERWPGRGQGTPNQPSTKHDKANVLGTNTVPLGGGGGGAGIARRGGPWGMDRGTGCCNCGGLQQHPPNHLNSNNKPKEKGVQLRQKNRQKPKGKKQSGSNPLPAGDKLSKEAKNGAHA